MLPNLTRQRLPRTELSYEYKESFEDVVGADFKHCTLRSSRRRKQLLDDIRDVGCRSIEPGDMVRVKDRWKKAQRAKAGALGKPPKAGKAITDKGPPKGAVGRVLTVGARGEGAGGRMLTVTLENGEILSAERFEEDQCVRQPEIFAAWYPEAPPLEGVQGMLGYLPDHDSYERRASIGDIKRQWAADATAKYANTNLVLIAKTFASACAGDTGMLSRYKLETALLDADVIPSQPHPQRRMMFAKVLEAGARGYMRQLQIDENDIVIDSPTGTEDVAVYADMMVCINDVINGEGARAFAQTCFDMYAYSGYIDREALRDGRKLGSADRLPQRERGFNSSQVKTLLQIFDQVRKLQVEEFLSGGGGKKGKKKGPDPAALAAGVPKTFSLKRHLSLGEFTKHLAQDPQLALAFLPVCFDILYEDAMSLKQYVPQARNKIPERVMERTHSEFFVTLKPPGE